ncbi:MAG: hypothetical protein WCJ58_07330 [bacterium]
MSNPYSPEMQYIHEPVTLADTAAFLAGKKEQEWIPGKIDRLPKILLLFLLGGMLAGCVGPQPQITHGTICTSGVEPQRCFGVITQYGPHVLTADHIGLTTNRYASAQVHFATDRKVPVGVHCEIKAVDIPTGLRPEAEPIFVKKETSNSLIACDEVLQPVNTPVLANQPDAVVPVIDAVAAIITLNESPELLAQQPEKTIEAIQAAANPPSLQDCATIQAIEVLSNTRTTVPIPVEAMQALETAACK